MSHARFEDLNLKEGLIICGNCHTATDQRSRLDLERSPVLSKGVEKIAT
jgi:hypothetical protein